MPNTILNKAKAKFDTLVEKAISRTSPKVQNEIKRVASKSVDSLVNSSADLVNAGLSVAFVVLLLKRTGGGGIINNPTGIDSLGRNFYIVYNDVKNTYNYYSKEVA